MNAEVNTSTTTASNSAVKILGGGILALLLGVLWAVAGIEAASAVLAVVIGGWAIANPRGGLWGGTGYVVFLCLFFPSEEFSLGSGLPPQYLYWGIGVALLTAGLFLAWLFRGIKPFWATRSLFTRFDLLMLLMLVVSLVASAYGYMVGNGVFPVARQLFGCILLPAYYFFARTFFRNAADVEHWLSRVCMFGAIAAVLYSAKILFYSLAAGRYLQTRSPITGLFGMVGAAMFVRLLDPDVKQKILKAGALASCALAIALMGGRFVAASLAATMIAIFILGRKRRVLTIGCIAGVLFLAGGYVIADWEDLSSMGGIPGQVLARFSPDISEDDSYLGRIEQMLVVISTVQEHPILGAGMGSEFSFAVPGREEVSAVGTYVDNGWGFVLLKMGMTGFVVFDVMLWLFAVAAVKGWPFRSPPAIGRVQGPLLAIFIFNILGFIAGPSFFQFTGSGSLGVMLAGVAVVAAHNQPSPSEPSTEPEGSAESPDGAAS